MSKTRIETAISVNVAQRTQIYKRFHGYLFQRAVPLYLKVSFKTKTETTTLVDCWFWNHSLALAGILPNSLAYYVFYKHNIQTMHTRETLPIRLSWDPVKKRNNKTGFDLGQLRTLRIISWSVVVSCKEDKAVIPKNIGLMSISKIIIISSDFAFKLWKLLSWHPQIPGFSSNLLR